MTFQHLYEFQTSLSLELLEFLFDEFFMTKFTRWFAVLY